MDPVDIERIEAQAQSILDQLPEWVWDGKSLPVPVDLIAERFDLMVCEVADLRQVPGCPPLADDEALSGMLVPGRGEIWVNATEAAQWPTRRRFTICHELGHWFLHRSLVAAQPPSEHGEAVVFCRSAHVDSDEAAARIEDEANIFASALMMPAGLMREHYRRTGGSHPALCRLFGASQKAMGRRMHTAIPSP